jgi:hypothetical protein
VNLKRTRISPTNLLPGHTEVLEMSRKTAVKIIHDLADSLANTGITKLVLRCDDGKDDRFLILSVKD